MDIIDLDDVWQWLQVILQMAILNLSTKIVLLRYWGPSRRTCSMSYGLLQALHHLELYALRLCMPMKSQLSSGTWCDHTILDGGHAHLCQSKASAQGHGWAGLMARNSANETHHGLITALDSIEIWVSESPSLSSVQHSRMHTGIIQPTTSCKGQVSWRKDRAKLSELIPGKSTPSNNWKKSHMAAI